MWHSKGTLDSWNFEKNADMWILHGNWTRLLNKKTENDTAIEIRILYFIYLIFFFFLRLGLAAAESIEIWSIVFQPIMNTV